MTNYSDTGGPQNAPVSLSLTLGQGPDGSPFVGPLSATIVLGGRHGDRRLSPARGPWSASSPDITKQFVDGASTRHAKVGTCGDATVDAPRRPTRDLGILSAGATASGGAGNLASVPFTLRYAGTATATANFTLTATTSLPNATVAVTPGALAPSSNSDTQALVAVGIPAGAKAGTYDVTLSARLANGQTRTRTGRLTVTGGGGGTTGGSTKLKLTTVLPKGLSAVTARTSGIAVLIGSNKTGSARVQLFQGTGKKNKKPKATKGVRLKVPGPTRVVLKSQKLTKGAYRVVITAGGRTFIRRASLTK